MLILLIQQILPKTSSCRPLSYLWQLVRFSATDSGLSIKKRERFRKRWSDHKLYYPVPWTVWRLATDLWLWKEYGWIFVTVCQVECEWREIRICIFENSRLDLPFDPVFLLTLIDQMIVSLQKNSRDLKFRQWRILHRHILTTCHQRFLLMYGYAK